MYNYPKDFTAPNGQKAMLIEDLVDYLNEEFTVGVMSDDGKETYDPDSELGWKCYRTLSPKKFEQIKTGLCYDYAEFLAKYFIDYYGELYPRFQLMYIESSSNDNHSFFTYHNRHGKFCIIEPKGLVDCMEGINEYECMEDGLNFMRNIFMDKEINKDEYYVIFRYNPTGFFGVPRLEFMNSKWQPRNLITTDSNINELNRNFKRFEFVL